MLNEIAIGILQAVGVLIGLYILGSLALYVGVRVMYHLKWKRD